jgi:polysaccharide pyruvyl transferase CsaB
MNPRVLISGYYGCGNAGDEAVLGAMLGALRSVEPGIRPVVLSATPAATSAAHGCPSLARMSPPALLTAIARTDLLISGGGSLIQDVTSAASALYYLFLIRLARLARKPVVIYAQGVGPITREPVRRATARLFCAARAVTVRDEGSATLLRELGVPAERVTVTADPVFGQYEPEGIRQQGSNGQQGFGLALRPWGDDQVLRSRASRLVSLLQAESPAPVGLLPMHEPGDRQLAEGLRQELGEGAEVAPLGLGTDGLLDWVSRRRALVAMRLHALIFAVIRGVPCVALSYDPKVVELMRLLHAEERCLDFQADPRQARDLALKSAEQGPVTPPDSLFELRRLAILNAEIALSALRKGS